MKKSHCILIGACIILLSSCHAPSTIIPKAINTVNSVPLNELNLERKDYNILKTITAEAVVMYYEGSQKVSITEVNNEFSLTWMLDRKTQQWYLASSRGIAKFGFLSNDYGSTFMSNNPEYVARNLAIYRLINACKVLGGDGVIEPMISTNVEQAGKDIILKTTASAKIIKLKTDK